MWIEQKNGSVVRRFVGHDRYFGQVAGQTMAYLYEALRLYVNFFHPSFKLIDKTRDGATTVQRYSQPTTPCDRFIQHDTTGDETTAALEAYRTSWIRCYCCIASVRPSLRWWLRPLRKCGKHQREKTSSVFSPSSPVCGARARSVPPTRRECERRSSGEPARNPSRGFGATCWFGCRPSRISPARR